MYPVAFIATEQENDLIVSFAVSVDPEGDILSLTLLRTPGYESLLAPENRGISVFWEEDEDNSELLLGVERKKNTVKLNTNRREFVLDLSCVRDKELQIMRKVFLKMNFDKAVKLKGF